MQSRSGSSLFQIRIDIGIESPDEGDRVDVFLARRYSFISRIEWQRRIGEGRVEIDSRKVKSSRRLKAGEILSFYIEKREEPAVANNIEIIYEDDHLLVINKPADLPVHPSGIYFKNTLTEILKERYSQFQAHLVYRLDRETSGLLVVAKSPMVARELSKPDQIKKFYVALIEEHGSEFQSINGLKSGFIGPDMSSEVEKKQIYLKQTTPGQRNFKTCATFFRLGRRFGGLALVSAHLITGRTHQIRATLHSLGFAMVGDKLYGKDSGIYLRFIHDQLTLEDLQHLRNSLSALHCRKLILFHPVLRTFITIKTSLPNRFFPLLQAAEQS